MFANRRGYGWGCYGDSLWRVKENNGARLLVEGRQYGRSAACSVSGRQDEVRECMGWQANCSFGVRQDEMRGFVGEGETTAHLV